jgi:hypothetical protein
MAVFVIFLQKYKKLVRIEEDVGQLRAKMIAEQEEIASL